MYLNTANVEVVVEEALKTALFSSFVMSRILQVQFVGEYITFSGWRRFFYPVFLMTLPVLAVKIFVTP